jgi:hypothetical protein
MKKLISIAACCLILSACTSTPIISGDSIAQQKTVSFPKQGQQVHVVVGGIVHLKAAYLSRYTYKLIHPLSMSMGFGMGEVKVSNKEMLSQSSLDGETVFCSSSMVFYGFTGPRAIACFQSAENGKFNSVKAAPDRVKWFYKQLSPPLDYVGSEMVISAGSKPLKRELIFESIENDTLFFTEKIYENSVETASRSKPLMIKIDTTPRKVTLNGAEINIISYTHNSLTYSLERAWD